VFLLPTQNIVGNLQADHPSHALRSYF